MNEAFITGSHAYGVPTPDSDVDLVILMELHEATKLARLLGHKEAEPTSASLKQREMRGYSIKIGKLNLVVCTAEARFDAWREGTRILEDRAPVSRHDAVALLDALFAINNPKP